VIDASEATVQPHGSKTERHRNLYAPAVESESQTLIHSVARSHSRAGEWGKRKASKAHKPIKYCRVVQQKGGTFLVLD